MSTIELDHVEVAPRMWDKTMAVPYASSSGNSRQATTAANSRPTAQQQPDSSGRAENATLPSQQRRCRFAPMLTNWRSIVIPALLIVAVIITMVVLWKYYTRYRTKKQPQSAAALPPVVNPLEIVRSEDMSKYEYEYESDEDSDNEFSTDKLQQPTSKRATVRFERVPSDDGNDLGQASEKCSDVDDGGKEGNSSTDDSAEDDDTQPRHLNFVDFPSEISEGGPDFKKIEELIMDTNVPVLQENNTASPNNEGEDGENDDTAHKPARKNRKTKRITLY